MRRAIRRSLGLLALLALGACARVSREEARRLVSTYNAAVSEAYRRADARLVDSVAGPKEGRKLTGLIGVRLDMGLTLDAEMTAMEVTSAERDAKEVRVETRESWRYRDRAIGSGKQVGEESVDRYEMLYVFRKLDGRWVVDETRFVRPPVVGRKTAPWSADARVFHGTITRPSARPGRTARP